MQAPKYLAYRSMNEKERKLRISNAEQSEKDSGPNPQGSHAFAERGFVRFEVRDDKGETIMLETYRQPAKSGGAGPKGLLFMFHGLNSYMGHGAHIAHFLSEHGIETVGFDHRGFGRSDGKEGFAESIDSHLNDSRRWVETVSRLYPEQTPKFGLGLSMGGMTVYHLALKEPLLFRGVILMAPALKTALGGFLVGAAKTLSKILPKNSRLIKPKYGMATRNPRVTDEIKEDPFAFSGRASLSTMNMIVSAMDESPVTFKEFRVPFLVVQGGLDKMVDPQVAFDLVDHSPSPDKDILFYEAMWHDIWHEPEIHEINQYCLQWLQQRLGTGRPD